jgi:hypothetical protein
MSPAADETCCSRNLLFPVVLKRTTRSRRPLAPPERAGACRGTHRVARRGFSRMTGCASHRDDGVARSERSVAMAISSSTAEASLGVDHPTGGRALREMVRRGTAFSWGLTRDQRRPRPALGNSRGPTTSCTSMTRSRFCAVPFRSRDLRFGRLPRSWEVPPKRRCHFRTTARNSPTASRQSTRPPALCAARCLHAIAGANGATRSRAKAKVPDRSAGSLQAVRPTSAEAAALVG